MSEGEKNRLKGIVFMVLLTVGPMCLFGLTVGVANGNVDLHWPTLHEIWQSVLASIAN